MKNPMVLSELLMGDTCMWPIFKANKTYRFTIAGDGSLKDQTLFAEQGSDGMTMDNQGNIYLTGKRSYRL